MEDKPRIVEAAPIVAATEAAAAAEVKAE